MLDGGLPAWEEQGLPLDSSPVNEAAVRAPADAAQQQQAAPQATSSYKAVLQVGCDFARQWWLSVSACFPVS